MTTSVLRKGQKSGPFEGNHRGGGICVPIFEIPRFHLDTLDGLSVPRLIRRVVRTLTEPFQPAISVIVVSQDHTSRKGGSTTATAGALVAPVAVIGHDRGHERQFPLSDELASDGSSVVRAQGARCGAIQARTETSGGKCQYGHRHSGKKTILASR